MKENERKWKKNRNKNIFQNIDQMVLTFVPNDREFLPVFTSDWNISVKKLY